MSRIDVDALRRENPLADVVAASGVGLIRRPNGYMAHCPFHIEDRTPSLSVDGVPGRFHCFGCGASGDVIDFVARMYGLDFRAAAERLSRTSSPSSEPHPPGPACVFADRPLGGTSRERTLELNAMAWGYFTQPGKWQAAERYICKVRGIDLDHLQRSTDGKHFVGLAPDACNSLSTHLQRNGAEPEEIMDAGLAHDRRGRLVDTFRGRVVVPVRGSDDGIEGFLGRDVTGTGRAPKYLNPTTTVAFDKSHSLYWPLGRPHQSGQQVVVVEGFIDALAVAARTVGDENPLYPCSASGVSVSPDQAREVARLTARPVLLALDADHAGQAGTKRWQNLLAQLNRRTEVVDLPAGLDPADFFSRPVEHGVSL